MKDLKTCMPAILRGSVIRDDHRRPSRRRSNDRRHHFLQRHRRVGQEPGTFRNGRHRGDRRARVGEQRQRRRGFDPPSHPRYPGSTITAIPDRGLHGPRYLPGPLLFVDHLDIVYVIFIGLIVASFGFALFGFLSARFAPLILKAPPAIVTPLIAVFCLVGAYASRKTPGTSAWPFSSGFFAYLIGEFGIPYPTDHPGLCPRTPRGDQFPLQPSALRGQSDDLRNPADLPGQSDPDHRHPAVSDLEGAFAQRDPFRSGLSRQAVGKFRSGRGKVGR